MSSRHTELWHRHDDLFHAVQLDYRDLKSRTYPRSRASAYNIKKGYVFDYVRKLLPTFFAHTAMPVTSYTLDFAELFFGSYGHSLPPKINPAPTEKPGLLARTSE